MSLKLKTYIDFWFETYESKIMHTFMYNETKARTGHEKKIKNAFLYYMYSAGTFKHKCYLQVVKEYWYSIYS